MNIKNKILVTGGSGFLGNHLVDELIKHKYKVIIVDKIPPRSKKATFIKGSFDNAELILPILNNVNQVFHLAAIVGVDNCDNNPLLVNNINIDATKKFINWVVKTDIDRFIFTSSSEVYGNIRTVPFREDMEPSPVSLYGRGKVIIEKYLKEVSKQNSLTVGIARLFNVYGPRQKSQFVIPIFLQKAFKNENIVVFGDGKQTRCFTYVEDVVEGLIKLMAHKSYYDIFNLGNNTEYSINKLANVIIDTVPNCNSIVVHKKHGVDGVRSEELEIQRRVPATLKAENLLGFYAKTPLQKGIEQMIQKH